jgi:hypothetical protein
VGKLVCGVHCKPNLQIQTQLTRKSLRIAMYMQVGKLVSWFADIELTNVNPTYQKQPLRIAMYKQVASVFHFCRDFCRGTSVVKVINTIEGGYRKGQFAKGSVTTNADTRQRELKLTSVLSKEACLTCTVKHFTQAQRGINTIQGCCSYSQESVCERVCNNQS